LDELLSVPTLASGTGYNESTIVHNLLVLWKHTDKVDVGLWGFGLWYNICNHLVFQQLEAGRQDTVCRELLFLACRHQVMELIIAKTFTLYGDPCNSLFTAIF